MEENNSNLTEVEEEERIKEVVHSGSSTSDSELKNYIKHGHTIYSASTSVYSSCENSQKYIHDIANLNDFDPTDAITPHNSQPNDTNIINVDDNDGGDDKKEEETNLIVAGPSNTTTDTIQPNETGVINDVDDNVKEKDGKEEANLVGIVVGPSNTTTTDTIQPNETEVVNVDEIKKNENNNNHEEKLN